MIYLNIYLAVWFFTNFEPLQELFDDFFELKSSIFAMVIWKLLSCQYCLTLWLTLLITHSWTMALLLSLIAELHKQCLHKKN